VQNRPDLSSPEQESGMSGGGAGTAENTVIVLRLSALDQRPLPSAVPSFRLHTKAVLMAWEVGDVAGDAEIIVSELTTNAIRAATEAAAGGEPRPVMLRLSAETNGFRLGAIRVEVWDASDELPERQEGEHPDEIGGRGLVLVETLSTRWGSYRTKGGGKVTWAVLTR
jgi:anti-sigma regulatory factor (Ser/Thr protein kinase)